MIAATKPKSGSKPDLESKMLAIITGAGLPPPMRQYRFHPPRLWKFDLAYPAVYLAVEVEGGTWTGKGHVGGAIYAANCEKYNAAVLDGWRVLRFTTDMLRKPEAVAATITAALAQKGWAG